MKPSVIARVRDIMPIRPLTRSEAFVVAERQADRLRFLLGAGEDRLDEQLLAELPRIEVRRLSPWPSSGATQWINGRWVIVLNSSEPVVRQRFSFAHELKHIIDHRFIELIHQHIPDLDRPAFTESVCDFFAGCLLMPRPLIKRSFATGMQRLDVLAAQFQVSQAAMATRLSQLGLTDPTPRCAPQRSDWSALGIHVDSGSHYQRAASPTVTAMCA